MDASDADSLVAKIRGFVRTLDGEERVLFAALLAPGVALADHAEVTGFGVTDTFETLRDGLRRHAVHLTGLGG